MRVVTFRDGVLGLNREKGGWLTDRNQQILSVYFFLWRLKYSRSSPVLWLTALAGAKKMQQKLLLINILGEVQRKRK